MKLTDEVAVPLTVNKGLNGTSNSMMLQLLGNPRNAYGSDCRPVTNRKLAARIVTDNVGPFRVTGFDLAVADLKSIFAVVKAKHPDIYAALGTAGMLCARLVRGSQRSISNHSWGTAIDLTLSGLLDQRGDGKTQVGLIPLAAVFNAHGWYWGARFNTEDAMHFEVSAQRFAQWKMDGKL